LRFSRVADRGPRLQNRPPSDRCKNLATYHGRVPGTCTDKTHTSCSVLGGLRARARPFRRFSCRFCPGSVRSAQRNIYRPHGHVRYLGRPGAHNLQCLRCPQTVLYFFAPTSAPGTLMTSKPPPEVQNRVPGSLTYPLDTVVTERQRFGGLGGAVGSRTALLQISRKLCGIPARHASLSSSDKTKSPRRLSPGTTGRAGLPWSVGTNLGEESAESGVVAVQKSCGLKKIEKN